MSTDTFDWRDVYTLVQAIQATGLDRHNHVRIALEINPEREQFNWARQELAHLGLASRPIITDRVAKAAAVFMALQSWGMTQESMKNGLRYWKRVQKRRNVTSEAKGMELANRLGLRLTGIHHTWEK